MAENSVVKENLTTAKDGKNYKTKFYNLDLIISVGYRVKSIRGTQFRIWANKLIKEYLIKGYNLNSDRMKNNDSLESIRFNHECEDNREKSIIVVSNIHGLLANKNMFTGKITHISKFYNNDNDPTKSDVYFEERKLTCEIQHFKVATADDIYTYRENYYLPDGTRPFLKMTIEEIERYLQENN